MAGNSKSKSPAVKKTLGQSPAAQAKIEATGKQTNKTDGVMDPKAAIALIVGIQLITPAVFAFMEAFPWTRDDHAVMGMIAMAVMSATLGVCYVVLKMFRVSNPLAVLFLFVVWTASTDTVISLSMLDFTTLGRFYIDKGEKYFGSAYGFFCLAWDGSFHLVIQSVIVYWMLTKQEYKFTLLVWCGSVVNSMAPLLLGASTGPYSDQIQLATALNTPYVFVPMAVMYVAIQMNPRYVKNGDRVAISSGLTDFVLFAYHTLMIVTHVYRAIYVMGSKMQLAKNFVLAVDPVLALDRSHQLSSHGFLNAQAMQSFFLLQLWHYFSLHEMFLRMATGRRGPLLGRHFVELCAVVFGAYLQATACWVGATVFHWENNQLTFRKDIELTSWFGYLHSITLVGSLIHFVHIYLQDVVEADASD